jgi:hypothetical protein
LIRKKNCFFSVKYYYTIITIKCLDSISEWMNRFGLKSKNIYTNEQEGWEWPYHFHPHPQDSQGEKAVILANYYVYSTYQWISSTIHVYDIESDGLTDDTQPSYLDNVAIFDILGNPAMILSSPPGFYPDTNS